MPFRNARIHFEDILSSIALIENFTAGMRFEHYGADPKTRSAVERQLQIITEAAYRLGPEANCLCDGPDWKGWTGMGTILRHAYHRIDDLSCGTTVVDELPPLRAAVALTLE